MNSLLCLINVQSVLPDSDGHFHSFVQLQENRANAGGCLLTFSFSNVLLFVACNGKRCSEPFLKEEGQVAAAGLLPRGLAALHRTLGPEGR